MILAKSNLIQKEPNLSRKNQTCVLSIMPLFTMVKVQPARDRLTAIRAQKAPIISWHRWSGWYLTNVQLTVEVLQRTA